MLRSYVDILKDLAQPLPKGCIAQRQQGTTQIDYLHWYVVAEILDTYAPGWTMAPVEVRHLSGKIMAKVALTLRTQEGEFTQTATGYDDDWKEGVADAYGDPLSNATAMAFKRAAVLFGVGRTLYDKDGALAQFRRHRTAPLDVPLPDDALVSQPPAPPRPETDRGQTWHNTYARVFELAEAEDFLAGKVTGWLKRAYGVVSTRDLTLPQLQDACQQLAAQAFTPQQQAWLRTPVAAGGP